MADRDIKVLSSNSTSDDILTFAKISEFNSMDEVDIADYLLVSGFRGDEELTRKIRISDIARYFNQDININMQWFIPVLKDDDGKIHWEFHNLVDVGTQEDAHGVEHPILPIDLAEVIGDVTDEKSGLLNPAYKAKLDSLDPATTDMDGLMSKEDKAKLNGIANNANNYVLPTADIDVLGGVKVDGISITINNGVIKANAGAPEATEFTINVSAWNPQTKICKIDLDIDTSKRNMIEVNPASLDDWVNSRVRAIQEDSTGITFSCANIPSSNLTGVVISMTVTYTS